MARYASIASGSVAKEIVYSGWESSQKYTDATFNDAMTFLDGIIDVSQSLNNVPVLNEELGELSTTVSAFVTPDAPEEPDFTANFPTLETTVDLKPVNSLVVPDEPIYNVVEPAYRDIAAPKAFAEATPEGITLGTHDYPDDPGDDLLPSVPSLRELVLPGAPEEITVTFDAVLPGALESAPSAELVFTEEDYASTLLDKVNEKLLEYISGFSTGLSPEVEQQIWDRARRRTSIATRRLIGQNERYYSASGWDMPGGDLTNKNYQAEQDAVNADIDESRSIAIAQANLEQQNFQFAFTTATQIEGILIGNSNARQQRAFEVARYAVQAAIELYGLKVTEFNANIQAYIAQSQVYSERIRAELSKVELYKAKLDGQRLISQLNEQDISIYREQINAVLAIYELYKTKLDAVKTKLQGDEVKLRQVETDINIFESSIRAKQLDYENFKIENDVELTKNEIFKSRNEAYNNQVDAFKSLTEARKVKQDADIEINQTIPLAAFKEKSEATRTLVQAESARLQSLTDVLKSRSDLYDSKVRAQTSKVETEVKTQEQDIRQLVAKSEIRIESVKANIASLLSETELLLEAAKAGAQVSSQLAAASLSTVSLSAGINDNKSSNSSVSDSTSNSSSTSHSNSATLENGILGRAPQA